MIRWIQSCEVIYDYKETWKNDIEVNITDV